MQLLKRIWEAWAAGWSTLAQMVAVTIGLTIAEKLLTHNLLWSLVFYVGWTAAVFSWSTIKSVDQQLFHKVINTRLLLDVSRGSQVILYISHIPSFEEWFKPELIHYLLESSPKLSLNGSSGGRDQIAKRFFILKKEAWKKINESTTMKSFVSNLAEIHELLGIEAYAVDEEALSDFTAEIGKLDFCIGFSDSSTLEDVMRKRSSGTVVVPNNDNIEAIDDFDIVDDADQRKKIYHEITKKLVSATDCSPQHHFCTLLSNRLT